MREVNHRAKNMLSVVHAIARQTATKNPEDFIERFCERIQAPFSESRPARQERMGWGRDRGRGPLRSSLPSPTSLVLVSPRSAPSCA